MNFLTDEQQELADCLTHLQRMTVINMITGKMSQRQAYFDAGGKAKNGNTADAAVCRMLKNVKVKAFHDSLLASIVNSAIMTREEALERLSVMARTSVKDIANFRKARVGEDENGKDVYQSVWDMKGCDDITENQAMAISELSAGKDGLKFKMHSQASAIKQLSEMEGWNSATKHELTGKDGEAIETITRVERVIVEPKPPR